MVAPSAVLLLGIASLVAAHGKPLSAAALKREIVAREHHAHMGARALGKCAGSDASQAMKKRAMQRRAAKVKDLRARKNIRSTPQKFRRDLAELEAWEEVNHNKTGVYNYDMFTSLETVFDANTSCVLAPEVTDGPYYVVGEWFRSNVKETLYSEGVDLFLEAQYVDIETCEPVPAIAVDIWNCNATGVYSGISTSGNYAAGGYNSTYLRGVQLTDSDGVVEFETIFPGHYQDRATHTHLLAHMNASLSSNGTVSVWNAPVTHIGQLFYPETLRSAVEAVAPYNTNTVEVTTNDEDMWSIVQADSSYDPFPEFLYLGDDITDGLFAWIQIGVNVSADYKDDSYYAIAAYIDADGGHVESSSSMGGGSGGDGGNGTMGGNETMSGSPPSGSGQSSA
ncbi:GPI anchored cell wall protein [Grosmannia clavigera kw1407]|uniref:GPI anchored cell wall protein n=1 Tax=Grosmannia clavigera (strain kw1407 / UAMH 11150) TaxID=655863 RepID=F0XDS0_GROCL|nr:GPI anchored cell wall protein [Grosmannia clavigera kw1407]EFX04350.1 GPI anchored cell wall protein [Grosmannia clavigera kw1407]